MTRSTPSRATFVFSAPGAPPEPQRTTPSVGIAREEVAGLLRTAMRAGLLGQEALEPRVVAVSSHQAIPDLVTGALDIAIIDLATLLGERALGWDGLAIAAFGPAADRSVGVAVVERSTWLDRRDLCERFVRACARAHEAAAADPTSRTADWWATCRPSVIELDGAVRWAEDGATADLTDALAWHAGTA